MRGLARVTGRAAHIAHERNVYLLAGYAQPEPFRDVRRGEAEEIPPNRLAFYTVRAADTWQSIAPGPGP